MLHADRQSAPETISAVLHKPPKSGLIDLAILGWLSIASVWAPRSSAVAGLVPLNPRDNLESRMSAGEGLEKAVPPRDDSFTDFS